MRIFMPRTRAAGLFVAALFCAFGAWAFLSSARSVKAKRSAQARAAGLAAWEPGRRPDGTARATPPLTHAELAAATRRWVEAGTPCPAR